jgi:hypothetical protein
VLGLISLTRWLAGEIVVVVGVKVVGIVGHAHERTHAIRIARAIARAAKAVDVAVPYRNARTFICGMAALSRRRQSK